MEACFGPTRSSRPSSCFNSTAIVDRLSSMRDVQWSSPSNRSSVRGCLWPAREAPCSWDAHVPRAEIRRTYLGDLRSNLKTEQTFAESRFCILLCGFSVNRNLRPLQDSQVLSRGTFKWHAVAFLRRFPTNEGRSLEEAGKVSPYATKEEADRRCYKVVAFIGHGVQVDRQTFTRCFMAAIMGTPLWQLPVVRSSFFLFAPRHSACSGSSQESPHVT